METTTLQAEVRTERGKGPARRLRAAGQLPAVIYGPDLSPTPLAIDPGAVRTSLSGPRGRNTIFNVEFDGKTQLAVVRDLNVEPVSRDLLHVDFLAITEASKLVVDVPIKTTGRAKGVVAGGHLKVFRRTLRVESTPDRIPVSIVIDVSPLGLFETIAVKDLELPEGVRPMVPEQQALATVIEQRRSAAKRGKGEEAKEEEAS